MSLSARLEAMREIALRDAEKVDDDTLLSKDLARIAEQIAERHYLPPLRLHNAVVGVPRAATVGVAGDPGREDPVQMRATRVDLYVPLDGVKTLAALSEAGDLDLPVVEFDVVEKRLVVGYIAVHPDAKLANLFFEESLVAIEAEVLRAGTMVREYNDSLQPALVEALEAARKRAKARQKFAAGLHQPRAFDRWGGKA